MSPFRHTAEPLPQPSAHATQPSLQQKADKADHRDAAGYPSGGPPIRHQKQKVPFRHTPGRNLSLSSWGRQSTHSRYTPEEPVRQDGIGKSFWHSRRTGTEPSKAQASGLDELPSSIRRNLFLNHRHALRNLHYSKKTRTRPNSGNPPNPARCAAR